MSHYIDVTDITDKVAKMFVTSNDESLEKWLTRTDDEINGMAYGYDLQVSEIKTPLNPVIKLYAIYYFCLQAFSDSIGVNNVESSQDEKYKLKAQQYIDLCSSQRSKCTKSLFSTEEANVRGVSRTQSRSLCRC